MSRTIEVHPAVTKKAAQIDAEYRAFLEKHSPVPFTEFFWQRHAEKIRSGAQPVHATLGGNLESGQPFGLAGKDMFDTYRKLVKIERSSRVIDFGCGTLRIGYHFINLLDYGNYYGIEPIADLLEQGKELIGPDLIAQKNPRLERSTDDAISQGEAFNADFVFSASVAFHVHPDDVKRYLERLRRLARKPGARLVFDAKTADRPIRYDAANWAWPQSFFEANLFPLRFKAYHFQSAYSFFSDVFNGHFEFLMPGGE